MQGDLRSKSFGISSLMNNPKTSKVLLDAWDSPVGSTKRAKAKSLLKSIGAAGRNFNGQMDGQGGPGLLDPLAGPTPSTSVPGGTPSPSPSLSVTGGIGAPPAPAPGAATADLPPIKVKTQFLPSVDHMLKKQPLGGPAPAERKQDAYKLTWTGSGYEPVTPSGAAIAGTPTGTKKYDPFLPGGYEDRVTAYAPSDATEVPFGQDFKYEAPKPPITKDGKPFDPYSVDPGAIVTDALKAQYGDYDQDEANRIYKLYIDRGMDPDAALQAVKDISGISPYVEGAPGADDIDPSAVEDMVGEDGDTTALDNWYNGLDGSAKEYYADLYEAVKTGVGPKTWAFQAMRNKKVLANMLGIPESELAGFPASGLLADHLNDLKTTIKGEYRINEQLDNLMNKTLQGLTIDEDLKSYIRGKDENLGRIEQLQDETATTMANMDLSNPRVAQRMKNYSSYLAILHGRQNQRYIGYLNTAVAYHNAEKDRAQTLYDSSIDKANEEYAQLAAPTEEEYGNMKSMLEEMYTNVDKRTEGTEAYYEMEKLKADAQLSMANRMLKAVEILKVAPEADLSLLGVTKESLGDIEAITEDVEYDDLNLDKIRKLGFDKEGIPTTYDPNDFVTKTKKADQDPIEGLSLFLDEHAGKVTGGLRSSGDITATLQSYADYFDTAASDIEAMEDPKELEEASENYMAYYKRVQEAAVSGLEEYFLSTENNIAELRAAIIDLTGKGLFNLKEEDRDKFLSGGKATALGKDLAGTLFDYYETNGGTRDQAVRDNFNDWAKNSTDEELAGLMAKELVGHKMVAAE